MITIGIDCGTQSTKVLALDLETGEIVAQAAIPYGLIKGLPPGCAEQHPMTWVDALERGMASMLSQLGQQKERVKAIGVSGQQHGFVPLNKEQEVIRPAKLWCDTSTVAECEQITEALGGQRRVREFIGMDLFTGYTASKILWLKRHEPANFAKLAKVLLPHDYLNLYLCGNIGMEYGDASGTGLFDTRNRRWSQEVCDIIDSHLQEKLPSVGSSHKAAGTLRPVLLQKWGLSGEVVVSAGGGDNMMGAIGTGNTRSGRVTVSLGTSGTVYAYSATPVQKYAEGVAAFCDSTDSWLPLICTMNVTIATEHICQLFGWSHAQFEAAAVSVPVGANGLCILPYLQGERTPDLPKARASIHGLDLQNSTAEHFARATLEGVIAGLAYGLERLRDTGIEPGEIRLTGGGSKSALWRDICANQFGSPVTTMGSPESAALGAAIQAAATSRPESQINDVVDLCVRTVPSETVDPTPERVALYKELRDERQRIVRKLHM